MSTLPSPVKLPKSIMTASPEEYYGQDAHHQPIELTVKEGTLPADLHGYMFIDVPVGSVEQGEEAGPGNPVFAGDGMIYQFDFSRAAEGKPSNLFRLQTETMQIVDYYTWPGDHGGLSPQFIPRPGNETDPTDGYMVCTVVSDADGSEFWVFDGRNLAHGPVCILGDERVNFGVTIHTTWLPEVQQRMAAYQVNIEEDYRQLVRETRNPAIKELFENYIYPTYGE